MPTKREREYYRMGFLDGQRAFATAGPKEREGFFFDTGTAEKRMSEREQYIQAFGKPKPKRKLSPWNKFVKANSKKPRFRFASGKLKLKKMAIAFRKTPAGRKKKRR